VSPVTLAPGVLAVHGAGQAETFWQQIAHRDPCLILTVAHTLTAAQPGISAAGSHPSLRRTTAAADAEYLFVGRTFSQPQIPCHPLGIPGPVVISRAMSKALPNLVKICVDAGSYGSPGIPHLRWGDRPANCVSSGQALPRPVVEALWQRAYDWGLVWGQQWGQQGYVILAESVPGGTTTALGVLLGLGFDAEHRVSSSWAGGSHALKLQLLAGLRKGAYRLDPLGAVAAVGDPMQPVVAGLALGCSQFCPVLLAGGTQMLAVLALITALGTPGSLAIGTTGWVVRDPQADFVGLAGLIQEQRGGLVIPCCAADLTFQGSRLTCLRGYDLGHVKEGVGCGGLSLAVMRRWGWDPDEILGAVEAECRALGFS